MTLPPELTRMIFEYADDEELAKQCMLNKNFATKVCNSGFWINKIVNRFGLDPNEIQQFKHNNTVWAYYKHLAELDDEHRPRTVLVERLYHNPNFNDVTRNVFRYNKTPKWLNKSLFEEDMKYKLADLIIDGEIDRKENGESVEEYYFGTPFKIGDIGTYDFLDNAAMIFHSNMFDWIQKQLVKK